MEVLLDTCGQWRVRSLLLLYLFVAEAAADCPRPERRENIVLTNEALLMNDFPEGSEVTLECANGYVTESGSGVINCKDEKWTEPDLTCKKKNCGPPKPQPNMSFDTSAGTLFGDVVRVICDKGYQITGSSYKQCYAAGWSGRAKCEIITCELPAEVDNARNSWDTQDEPKYGEMIRYTCDAGYTLIGRDSITCSESGEYDSEPPQCKGVTTEDRITTNTITSAPTFPSQEASTSTDSSATSTAHRDKAFTTGDTPTVSPSLQGGRGILTAEDKDTTTNVTPTTASSLQGHREGADDTEKDVGYIPVIVSVVAVSLVAAVGVLFLHKYLLRRKGSYDTREDLKPELLQFQNL